MNAGAVPPDPFGVRSGSVRDSFGVRSENVQGPFVARSSSPSPVPVHGEGSW